MLRSDSLRYGDSSDSENEDGALEKLTSAVGHLFTGDSSDGELSESGDSSAPEEEDEDEEAETEDETASARSTAQERAVFLKKHCKLHHLFLIFIQKIIRSV